MQLAALLDQVTYGEEENIIVQGRLGDSMYIIEPGCSPPKVFVEGVGLVATLEAGSFFGELAILDAPASWRTATVRTASETTLLRLSQKDIHRLLSGEKCQELLQMGSRAYDERQQLRGSDDVKTAVRKLWRLLVAESFKLEEKVQGRVARLSKWKRMRMSAVGGNVSRDGYNNLHMCISKYLVQGFTRTEAEESAEADWAEDITAFGGDSKINLHLENLKQQLLAATEQSVGSKGWQGLFELYDDDGSGEIDLEEFTGAVRKDMRLPQQVITDEELRDLFAQADADGAGSLDSAEFADWIVQKNHPDEPPRFADLRAIIQKASHEIVTKIGWKALFNSFDADGEGTLDFSEFSIVVRQQCDLTEASIERGELRELFNAVDSDRGGSIDEEEFKNFLLSDPLAEDMTAEVFEEAMFQLCQLWVVKPKEEQYVKFLHGIFDGISRPNGAVRKTHIF